MKKVFVSGCYDILHAGHIQFFIEAKALGDHLTVCFASDKVLWAHKKRRPSIPEDHKKAVIQALSMVDHVVMGTNMEMGLDFKDHFLQIRPDILAVTADDKYEKAKRELCADVGTQYYVLPKTPPMFSPVTTTQIVKWIRAPQEVPLRVDFAGGWLDVPRLARPGGFIVNCAISPLVSLTHWDYAKRSGLGGSGAWALLNGDDGVRSEIDLGVGWQDPAIIEETGLCVWESGPRPVLRLKRNGDMLKGLMALYFTESEHDTPRIAANDRNYDLIYQAGQIAAKAVLDDDVKELANAVRLSYEVQIDEGMDPLPDAENHLACKYCGGGWGGNALYLFGSLKDRDDFVAKYPPARAIEPFIRPAGMRT
jgi:cytidyltransferase-like protein